MTNGIIPDGQIILDPSTIQLAAVPTDAPTGLTCSFSNGTITATWNAVSGAAKYRVHLYPCAGDSICLDCPGRIGKVDEQCVTTTSYTKSGLTGTAYNVHVRACTSGCPSSGSCGPVACKGCGTPPEDKYKCSGTPDYTCNKDASGTQTLAECQADCAAPTKKWECTDPKTNTCTKTDAGTHGTEAGCKAAADCQSTGKNVTTTILIIIVLLLILIMMG